MATYQLRHHYVVHNMRGPAAVQRRSRSTAEDPGSTCPTSYEARGCPVPQRCLSVASANNSTHITPRVNNGPCWHTTHPVAVATIGIAVAIALTPSIPHTTRSRAVLANLPSCVLEHGYMEHEYSTRSFGKFHISVFQIWFGSCT